MYTMKDVCDKYDLPYETLRYYCNEGLIPNIKRDHNNYRIFDDRNLETIKGIQCLRKCGLGIKELKHYMELALEGQSSIKQRMMMLEKQKLELLQKQKEIEESLNYIKQKNQFYQDVLEGKIKYKSNIIDVD